MTREDISLVGNILRHADAVVTPASTITLEAAIFDRPTVVSIYHTYQPEQAGEFYGRAFGMHFKRIRNLDLVPVVERAEEFAPAINRCLREPGWYKEQRARMVRDYVTYTDGCSTQRLFELAVRLAAGTESLRDAEGYPATATGHVARVSE
jgi:CDP-glycerol glycerophosphotransferase (TagB/SpsB family)